MRVTFFSPHAGVELHSYPERQLIESYVSAGHQVTIISCHGEFKSPCISMSARNIDLDSSRLARTLTCMACQRIGDALYLNSENLTVIQLADLITCEDFDKIEALCADITIDNWIDFTYLSLPLGKIASYEILLKYKLSDLALNQTQFRELIAKIRLTMISATAAKIHISSTQPDLIVAYNMLYGVNRVWAELARQVGAKSYSIQLGWDAASRAQSLMIYHDDNHQLLLANSLEANAYLDLPLSETEVARVQSHLLALTSSSDVFVYSQQHAKVHPFEIRHLFNLDPNKPTVLVPLSSEDERFAASFVGIEFMQKTPALFQDQVTWIVFVINLARKHPEWQFVFRLHPRMFPNAREQHLAGSAQRFVELFADVPENVRLNSPSDNCSLSDILQVTDVVLAGKSSVGAQCAAYGLPILLHDVDTLNAFSSKLGRIVHDANEVSAAIEELIKVGCQFNTSLLAYRWFNFLNSRVALQFSTITESDISGSFKIFSGGKFGSLFLRRLRRLVDFSSMRAGLQYIFAGRQTRKFIESLELDPLPLYPLVRVTEMGLDGLQQLKFTETRFDARQEALALIKSLREIGNNLGEFPDDPRCLSSRILRMIETEELQLSR